MKRSPLISAAVVALVAVFGLTACSPSTGGSPAPAASASSGGGRFGSGAGGGFPSGTFTGAAGLVAAVTGSTAQVQGTSSQTAVTWTSATKFTAQQKVSASVLKVGDCVIARPARTAAPSGSDATNATTVAAATVEITPASASGTCTAGRIGARTGGGSGSGSGGQGRFTPAPGATPGAQGRGFGAGQFGAIGKVATLSAGEFTVTSSFAGAADTRVTHVTYTASTAFTEQTSATSAAVKVGVCVTALGKTDDTGALAAATVAISQPVGGSCQTGFGGRGFGGSGAGTGSGSNSGAGSTGTGA